MGVRTRRVAMWNMQMWRMQMWRVRMVAMWRVRMVAMEDESTAAAFAQAVRGAGGAFGIGGGSGGGLHEQGCANLSHRATQLEEEQHKCEHRVAGCTDSNRTQQLEARGPRGQNGSRSDGHQLNLREGRAGA